MHSLPIDTNRHNEPTSSSYNPRYHQEPFANTLMYTIGLECDMVNLDILDFVWHFNFNFHAVDTPFAFQLRNPSRPQSEEKTVRILPDMADSNDSPHTMFGSDEDTGFGWQLFHDRQRNLIYYLHNYTGEVRWPRPETVGFVMHGLKPLPAHAGHDARTDTTFVNPDIWSPYYPHVVMLPSGLVRVHPGLGSENQSPAEIWCGYNRFPLTTGSILQHYRMNEPNVPAMMMPRPRVLPPTWEESRSGSPFLPPYPVTILQRDNIEEKAPAPAAPTLSTSPSRVEKRSFQTLESDVARSYSHPQNVELGQVQSTRNCPAIDKSTASNVSAWKHPAAPKGVSAPNTEKKEHNRKGYLLRQARKLMRETGVHSAPSLSTTMSKQ